jgi:hypothetical protein
MFNISQVCSRGILFATLYIAGSCAEPSALAQATGGGTKPGEGGFSESSPAPVLKLNSNQMDDARTGRAANYYRRNYGIEVTSIRPVSSGEMVRLTYRIIDPVKAKPLIDKDATPYLVDRASGLKLEVPTMEKIGQLRQSTSKPQAGRVYWMIFANTHLAVKAGSRVDVVIGHLHMNDLLVD